MRWTTKQWHWLLGLIAVALIALPASTLADPATPVTETNPVVIDEASATDAPGTDLLPTLEATDSPTVDETVSDPAEGQVQAAAAFTLYVDNQTGWSGSKRTRNIRCRRCQWQPMSTASIPMWTVRGR